MTLRIAALLVALLLVVACSPRVPVAPRSARGQDPHAAAAGEWRGRGRLEIHAFGQRFSAGCLLRAQGGGARAVFLGDEGLMLADLEVSPAGVTVHRAVDALRPRVDALAALIAPYARLEEQRAWRRGVLHARTAQDARRYGGDPLLLRRIDGRGWPLSVGDYAPGAGGLIPRLVAAHGPLGIGLRLRLTEVGPLTPP